MKNKEFWKGAVAGALVVTCIGTGAFAGTGLAAKGTALGDRKCTSKLAYLEELIDRYYLGDKDEEKLQEGLYAGLLYGLNDPYSRYYTAEEYDSENSSKASSLNILRFFQRLVNIPGTDHIVAVCIIVS